LNNTGSVSQAISAWERSRDAYASGGFEQYAAILELNMGAAHQELGHLESAATAYEKARISFEAAGQPQHAAIALGNLGELRFHAGNLEEALDLHLRAIGLKESQGLPIGYDQFRIAEVYHRQGRLDPAFEAFGEARAALFELGESVAEALVGFARLESTRRNLGDAIELARQAARAARDEGDPDTLAFAQLAEAEAELLKPEPDLGVVRNLLIYVDNRVEATEHKRLGLEARRMEAQFRWVSGEDPGDLSDLIRDAEAAGYFWVKEDARELADARTRRPRRGDAARSASTAS
jgi:tetratricopeptide (TPR) repeat protein